jgi:hypothetical protein
MVENNDWASEAMKRARQDRKKEKNRVQLGLGSALQPAGSPAPGLGTMHDRSSLVTFRLWRIRVMLFMRQASCLSEDPSVD